MTEHPNVARCQEIYEILEHGTMDQNASSARRHRRLDGAGPREVLPEL